MDVEFRVGWRTCARGLWRLRSSSAAAAGGRLQRIRRDFPSPV